MIGLILNRAASPRSPKRLLPDGEGASVMLDADSRVAADAIKSWLWDRGWPVSRADVARWGVVLLARVIAENPEWLLKECERGAREAVTANSARTKPTGAGE